MVCAGCHVGKGIICLDEKNASAACNRNHLTCGWAKFPDILYIFRSTEISDGLSVYIPSNAIGVNTGYNNVSWLEPVVKINDKKIVDR